jgi:hypothetical protein
VQVTLAQKGRGRRHDGPRDDARQDRGPRGARDAKPRRGPTSGAPPGGGPSSPRADRPRPDRARAPREDSRAPAARGAGPDRRGAPDRRDSRRPQELVASTVHRNALLATLRPEQLPIAEQLLRGGLPAVRQAIEEQNRAALAQGRPTIAPETILTIADDLLPLTTLAAWKDRAVAVQHAGPTVRLRDLRAAVTAARTVTLDEEARGVLKELQGQLHTKTEELRTQWVAKVESLLAKGEVVAALSVVSRAPDPGTRCPDADRVDRGARRRRRVADAPLGASRRHSRRRRGTGRSGARRRARPRAREAARDAHPAPSPAKLCEAASAQRSAAILSSRALKPLASRSDFTV